MPTRDRTIDAILAQIGSNMELEAETEYQLLEELRGHLEQAVEDGRAKGLCEQEALSVAVDRLGIDSVAHELQAAHCGWGTMEGVAAAALPVLFALIMRWVVFAPEGTLVGWDEVLRRPAFWTVAFSVLLLPMWCFPRRRHALVSWAVFWGLSVIFVIFNGVHW